MGQLACLNLLFYLYHSMKSVSDAGLEWLGALDLASWQGFMERMKGPRSLHSDSNAIIGIRSRVNYSDPSVLTQYCKIMTSI